MAEMTTRASAFFCDIKRVFPKTLPVLFGYVVLSIAYSLIAQSMGLPGFIPIVFSICLFGGSMQFLATNLLIASSPIMTLIAATLVIQSRHIAYGFSMLPTYQKTGKIKTYLAFALTDETYALLTSTDSPEGMPSRRYYLIVSSLNHFYWISGTILGVIIGRTFTLPLAGAEFALTALFIVLLIEQLKQRAPAWLCLVGGIWGIIFLLTVGPARMLFPAVSATVLTLVIADRFDQTVDCPRSADIEGLKKKESGEVDKAADESMMNR
ncbi:MAG TPA: branched-chain amino acid ABC transporter permease [Clostridiaceae bacterium]|nr:branched-chain amino acid ABC transporter permease [Clostridiaceae bacterium]